ncbi:hypothetical protein [Halotia branconii]|uniref:Uncharacterized protein n=1 Tax=Halotia branconii CENA392 TaxID=1539056 RepID=A0AAJ6NSY5_9CYAN|nr:hypothetical protein [Halotia branconii]WGV25973.1 hypothetical protein QI031_00155 [Halotia branconii CENA392]
MDTINRFSRPIGRNDPADFQMPYKIYGAFELTVMQSKYQRLNNYSQGLSIRFLNDQTQQFYQAK